MRITSAVDATEINASVMHGHIRFLIQKLGSNDARKLDGFSVLALKMPEKSQPKPVPNTFGCGMATISSSTSPTTNTGSA